MSRPPAALDRRRAGILLHPTSLPGGTGNGELGPHAYRFVDFLKAAGMSVWQMLPHGPTHGDRSPYQALSVHAGNPFWISLELLAEHGWLELPAEPGPPQDIAWRSALLRQARQGFQARASDDDRIRYRAFVEKQRHWLNDYALYVALRAEQGHRSWLDWPAPLRDRESHALEQARARLAEAVEQVRFDQFVFFQQWLTLKDYANAQGVLLFGDMPIFVAHDSAEVWARREQFDIDAHGRPATVAGVPPDYFSETGQRWGNPHYDWARMQADGFAWWRERIGTSLMLYDLIRIDHFRGFEAAWAIPAKSETAVEGEWVKAPGTALFRALQDEFNRLPLVAEDLGIITPEVEALRRDFALPGMKVLQFAFDGGADNPYLPHNHEEDMVIYTGTHDNDTTVGWHRTRPTAEQKRVEDYLGVPQEPMPWPLIRATFASVGRLAIIPLQDALSLGSEHRMNTPGTTEGNWAWRFEWAQIPAELPERLKHLVELYGRSAT